MSAPRATRPGRSVLRALVLVVVALLAVAGVAVAAGQASRPGLKLQVGPASQSVERGTTATYQVAVTSTNGFSGTVTLAVTGLPTGATAAFSPGSVTLTSGATAGSTLSVTTASTTPLGSYSLTVTGTSGTGGGKVTGSVTAGLTVNAPLSSALTMSVDPASVTLSPGSTGVYSIALTRTNVPGTVTFGLLSDLPGGATARFVPASTTGSTSSLEVMTAETVADGTYRLYLVATGTDSAGRSRSAYAYADLVVTTRPRELTLSGDANGPLAPGVTRQIDLVITNPGRKPVSVTNLSVALTTVTRTQAATSAGQACTTGDYSVGQYDGVYPLSIPAGSSRSLSQLGVPQSAWPRITMLDSVTRNQDGCKGASLALTYAAAGSGS